MNKTLVCSCLWLCALGCGGDDGPSGSDSGPSDSDVPDGHRPDGAADADRSDTSACEPNPCDEPRRTQCEQRGGSYTCLCDPGFREDDTGACVAESTCAEDTCSGHGECSMGAEGPECACDAGYTGSHCSECDTEAGYYPLPDGSGQCSDHPCDPNPCGEQGRRRCVISGGDVSCECDAGTHDEDGRCVADETCTETTCSSHGQCHETGDGVRCQCDTGYDGDHCEQCDEPGGYHDDGLGGCTTDPCLPNPCNEDRRTVCQAEDSEVTCLCDAGYHLDAERCVVDEQCTGESCSGRGECTVVEGRRSCSCDEPYDGPACELCNEGYHDDGHGECTTDPCLPNPCTEIDHRTECVVDEGQAHCECDGGFHDDGVGGCTDDPCLPDPCFHLDLACRPAPDGYECYLPECDDENPCTVDTFEGGGCVFTRLEDDQGCSTTVCVRDQSCRAGQCQGGEPVLCNDDDPCTADSCDPVTGCDFVVDDSLVPHDEFSCTEDSCEDGVAYHRPRDARCDEGSFCSGAELCEPTSTEADARGCVVTDVPTPPHPPSFCRRYECNDDTEGFDLIERQPGTGCNDGIGCTVSDACTDQGRCEGTVTASCFPEGSCSETEAFDGSIDVPVAHLAGRITQDGGDLPETSYWGDGVTIYLVSRDTGAWQELTHITFDGPCCTNYQLEGDGTYQTQAIAGVYDILYRRDYSSSSNIVDMTELRDGYANGLRVLAEDVVVPQGYSVLDIDIPTTAVIGTITQDGGALPETSYWGDGVTFYLVSRDTGAWQELTQLTFDGPCCTNYQLEGDGTYEAQVVEGVYDVLYRRDYSSSSNIVDMTEPRDGYANGLRVLAENVELSGDSAVLDIDIPTTAVTGVITQDGGALPETSYWGDGVIFYLVSRDTGAWQELTRLTFDGPCCTNYQLEGDGTYEAQVVEGRYDVLYRRDYSSSSNIVDMTELRDGYANGLRVLDQDVEISGAGYVLDIDVPTTSVTGSITQNGGDLPETSYWGDGVTFYLVSHDTGAWQELTQLTFDGPCCTNYQLEGDGTYEAQVVEGTYDVLYRRDYSSSSNIVDMTELRDGYANGLRLLDQNVTITGQSFVLDIDVPTTSVTGSITQNGGDLPDRSYWGDGVTFYLRSHDTGAWQELTNLTFDGPCCTNYQLEGDGTYEAQVVEGTYDVLYRRDYSSSSNIVDMTELRDGYANGMRVLQPGVEISGTDFVLDIDVPTAEVQGTITQDGGDLPETSYWGNGVSFYLVADDTGAWQELTDITFDGPCCTNYQLEGDGTYEAQLVSGAYHVLYRRDYSSSSNIVDEAELRDGYAHGLRLLRRCVAVP